MLDLFFRKYAWTANLALLFAAAWLSAKTVNTFVGAVIRPKPQTDFAAPAGPPPRPALPVSLEGDKLYKLIGIEPPKQAEDAEAAAVPQRPQTCNDPRAAPLRSELRLQLVATVLAEIPRYSLATITDLNSRETHVVGVGDDVQGARLLGLERIRDDRDVTGNGFKVVAIVCNAGTKEYVDAEGAGAASGGMNVGTAPLPPGQPGFAAAPPGGGPIQGVRSVGPNRYEIDKGVLDSTLSNLNNIATQARIVPSFKNGVANGFKLFSIQPGSLYASIGIENGDVIQRINGYEINSPDKALEIYTKLKESSHVTIEGDHNGLPFRKEYNITGP